MGSKVKGLVLEYLCIELTLTGEGMSEAPLADCSTGTSTMSDPAGDMARSRCSRALAASCADTLPTSWIGASTSWRNCTSSSESSLDEDEDGGIVNRTLLGAGVVVENQLGLGTAGGALTAEGLQSM